jgi:RNA polymerase sigma factor (sigma-70 family)
MTAAAPSRLLSDAAIARRAAAGDERAFAAIFERYHQDLYRYCAAILGDAQDAQDAVQNTMLKVLRALPGEKRDLKLKPWLYRVAHNEAIDMIRVRKGTDPLGAEALAAAAGPAEEAEARSRLQQLVADIADLPPRQRGALVMKEMSGLSHEQIAGALQTSAAVARQTIYEARLNLRQMKEGREMSCEEVMRSISDGDGRVLRRRDIRAHLDRCDGCRAFQAEIDERRRQFTAIAPLPAAASAGLLQGLLGGGAGGTGAAGGAAGAVAGKAVAGSAAVKSAAAVLAVSAIGVVAADQRGTIDLGVGNAREAPPAKVIREPAQAARRIDAADARAANGARSGGAPPRRPGGSGQGIDPTSSVARAGARAPAAPAAAGAAEQAPQTGGRHLGQLKGSERGASAAKPEHPAKGQKGASANTPGKAVSPGQSGHVATGNDSGHAAAETHRAHSDHPSRPDQSRAPAAKAEPAASAGTGNGEHGKPATE